MQSIEEESSSQWDWFDWLPLTLALLAGVAAYQWWHLRRFHRRSISMALPAWPLFGSFLKIFGRRLSIAEWVQKAYEARGASLEALPMGGIFEFGGTPVLIVRDPRLIREVCVKQFDLFRNHRPLLSQKADKLFARSLFALNDQQWKDMRTTMSPAFTGSKLRVMLELMSQCGRQSAEYIKQKCKELPREANGIYELELKDFFSRLANDIIATTAFGIHCDSFRQEDNEFFQMGKEITNVSGLKVLFFVLWAVMPKLAELLDLPFIPARAQDFFRSLIHDTVTQRDEQGIYRPDVLQLMMEARADPKDPERKKGLTEEDISSQSVLFFFAGFDTVSSLMCFTCHLLATHPTAQWRLHRELDEALARSGGRLDYDTVQSVKFLDMVVNEALRLYPPAPVVDRVCAADAVVTLEGEGDGQPPRTALHFKRGDLLWLPIFGVQRDPRFWRNPDAFDPERFSDENKHRIQPFTFMPFGLGPRMCIAQRFAVLEAKVGLAHLLARVSLTCVPRTRVPMRLSPLSFNTASADGFWVGVSLRDQDSALGNGEVVAN